MPSCSSDDPVTSTSTSTTPSKSKQQMATTKKKKNRCAVESCNKKLSLSQISIGKCKCENVFCSSHRNPEDHNCTYDFKMEGKKRLEIDNPKVEHQKIDKI